MDILESAGRHPVRHHLRCRSRPSWLSTFVLLSLLVTGVRPVAIAQEVVPKPGDRIRVTLRDGESDRRLEYVGKLVGWDAASIRWDSDGSAFDTPVESVTKLELSRGKKSNWLKGGAIGAAAGFAAGFVLFAIACNGSRCDDTGSSSDADLQFAFAGGAVGAGAGFLLGGLIGAGLPTDRWSEVPSSVYKGGATKVARRSR